MKYLSNLLVLSLLLQSFSSVALAQAMKPSDLILSQGARTALQQSFGENWEELVNSDPERFSTGQNRGFLPADWKKIISNTPDKASVTSAKLPSDFIVGEEYQANFAKAWGEDWKTKVNNDPDSFSSYLPDNWKSIIADNPTCTYIYKARCIFPDKAEKASDLIRDTNNHDTLEKVHGKDWRSIVDSDPDKFVSSGFIPQDWKNRVTNQSAGASSNAASGTNTKPSDLIVSSVDVKVLKDNFGENWPDVVNSDPERFKSFLPKDWKEKTGTSSAASNDKSAVASAAKNDTSSQATNNTASNSSASQKDEAAKVPITNQILAIGTGIIGSNILLSCKMGGMTPSLYAFMAGSLVYIGSEITGAKAQQAFIKAKKEEVEALRAGMTEGGDLQRGIIEAKLKEEEEKLAFVTKRKNWTMAVAAVYGAATGLAAMEWACVTNKITLPACTQWVMAGCEGGSSLPTNKMLSTAVLAAYGLAAGNAGGTAASRYGTALVAGLGVMVPALNTKVAVAYQTPKNRMITFGAGTALTGLVLKDLSAVQKDLEGNVNQLKALLADFRSKTDATEGLGKDGQGASIKDGNHNISSASGNVNKLSSGTSIEKSCWGVDSSGTQTYSAGACNKTLQLTKPKFNSKFSLPTLQKVANTGVDMAQAVARGDMAKADIAAADLASNAMKVKKITDDLMKQINDQNKKSGKEGIDLDAEIQKNLGEMRRGLSNGMGSQGVNLADFANGSKAGLDKNNPLLYGQDILKDSSTSALDPAGRGAGFNISESSSDEIIDANSQIANGEEVANHTIDDFETAEADILNRPDTSIFKQVSNRYLLNFSKFFNNEPKKGAEGTPIKQTK